MAYGNNNGNAGQSKNYGKPYVKPAVTSTAIPVGGPVATANTGEFVDKALLRKFARRTKSGEGITFTVGDTDMILKANTRVVISPLTEKRIAALEASAKAKGFKGTTPSHELAVLPIDDVQA